MAARSPESRSRLRRTPIPAIAVFARAPVAGHAKTRLIPPLGAQGAARFQAALISDTLRKVASLKACVKPYLFWAGNPITSSAVSQKFVEYVSPRSGRKHVARGVSRGFGRTALTPIPSPARAGEGCPSTDGRGEGCFSQGLRPGLLSAAPAGAVEAPSNRLDLCRESLGQDTSGRDAPATFSWAPACTGEFRIIEQKGRGLGERQENAFRRLLRVHPSCVVIGTDSPTLPARLLRQALRELQVCDSVLGPCPDGGYYLVALRRPLAPETLRGIFHRVRWSTAFAFRDTLRNLLRQGLSCSILEGCTDVDSPRDLQHLKKNLSRDRTARRLAPATWNFLRQHGSAAL